MIPFFKSNTAAGNQSKPSIGKSRFRPFTPANARGSTSLEKTDSFNLTRAHSPLAVSSPERVHEVDFTMEESESIQELHSTSTNPTPFKVPMSKSLVVHSNVSNECPTPPTPSPPSKEYEQQDQLIVATKKKKSSSKGSVSSTPNTNTTLVHPSSHVSTRDLTHSLLMALDNDAQSFKIEISQLKSDNDRLVMEKNGAIDSIKKYMKLEDENNQTIKSTFQVVVRNWDSLLNGLSWEQDVMRSKFQDKLNDFTRESCQLKTEYESKVSELKREIDKLDNEFKVRQSEWNHESSLAKNQISLLENSKNDLISQLDNVNKEYIHAKASLESQVNQYQTELANIQRGLEIQSQEFEKNLQAKNSQLQQVSDELQNTRQTFTIKINELQEQIVGLKEIVLIQQEKLALEFEKHESESGQWSIVQSGLEVQLKSCIIELEKKENLVKSYELELTNLNNLWTWAATNLRNNPANFINLWNEFNAKIKELKKDSFLSRHALLVYQEMLEFLSTLCTLVKDQNKEIQDLNETLSKKDEMTRELNSKMEKCKKQLNCESSKCLELSIKLEATEEMKKHNESENKHLNLQVQKIIGESATTIQELKSKVQALQGSVANLEKEKLDLQENANQFEYDLDDKISEFKDLSKERDDLQDQLIFKNNELRDLSNEKEGIQVELNQLNQELQTLKCQIDIQDQKLVSTSANATLLSNQVQDFLKEKEILISTNNSLNSELTDMRNELNGLHVLKNQELLTLEATWKEIVQGKETELETLKLKLKKLDSIPFSVTPTVTPHGHTPVCNNSVSNIIQDLEKEVSPNVIQDDSFVSPGILRIRNSTSRVADRKKELVVPPWNKKMTGIVKESESCTPIMTTHTTACIGKRVKKRKNPKESKVLDVDSLFE